MIYEMSGCGLLDMRRGGRSELQAQAEKQRGEGESRLASRLPNKKQTVPVMNGAATDSLILLLTVPGDAGLSGLLASVDLEHDVAKSRVYRPTSCGFGQSYSTMCLFPLWVLLWPCLALFQYTPCYFKIGIY